MSVVALSYKERESLFVCSCVECARVVVNDSGPGGMFLCLGAVSRPSLTLMTCLANHYSIIIVQMYKLFGLFPIEIEMMMMLMPQHRSSKHSKRSKKANGQIMPGQVPSATIIYPVEYHDVNTIMYVIA